ncbi:RpiR family transcriptional regulator [Heyndrickxia shackletonii]|uniref:RpiR family transcriptional regulator n=1 Tax=Heyndrickxia shackletonii TaxID=157838 RepID=A0A0Q3WV02_9BACI|nr:MurR/RpiR family transcriptional regulator [Heyndrickxia shackletonii]KQL52466.1 RpiR family transcriptional regulator [Heyndrickxia shackletonii]MBB2479250.1 MurR/RpiR family transcriptional regulator [Bacillus sp. APMAM]NEY98965.1 MurR/RpiR family transcriptional regulator [Heyndrickxia shackletonii]RTZ57149.1 MurR/RpiR family transcriptional regulator [Bacillus sp. SAJ1]
MSRFQSFPCLPRIKTMYSQFSEKEKAIADYILEDPQKIIHSTINQVADDLFVADATVFRFCKRIGFNGFQSMKIALASEIVAPIKNIHEEIQEGDSVKVIAEKVFKANIQTLEETLHTFSDSKMEDAIKLILEANVVGFYGSGGSGVIAMDAHHKFMRTGIQSMAYTDSHFQIMSAAQLTEQDVVVLISHSGSNKDIMDVLQIAKKNGAKSIGITNLAKSPLSQKVDIPLYTISQETDYRSEALSSRIAQLSIIDSLYVNVMARRDKFGQESLQKMREAISLKKI